MTFNIDSQSKRNFFDDVADAPLDLGSGVSITPRFTSRRDFTFTPSAANRAIQNPLGGFEIPTEYTLIIKKTNGAGSITTWGSQYVFPGGSAPTFLSMTTLQFAKVTMKAIAGGSGPALLCDYEIHGSPT